jgi:polyhydroxyalkanoate synthesis regulator phasin
MPKAKKPKETPKEQAARFAAEVERMVAAGELNATEADDVLDRLISGVRAAPPNP